MPNHKFRYTDLETLEQKPLQGAFSILLVGTFNADILNNDALWFYGRQKNMFWSLFPRMLGDTSLHPNHRPETINNLTPIWKEYCSVRRIIIVDLFKSVLVNLNGHSDSELQALAMNQVIPFDYETAFQNCSFEKVLFTWKGVNPNLLTSLKTDYINYFAAKGSSIGHLLTPSKAYRKSDEFKLNQWIEVYNE